MIPSDVREAIGENNPFAFTYWALCDYACRDGIETVVVGAVLSGGASANVTVAELGSENGTTSRWRAVYYIEYLTTARHGQEPLLFRRASDVYDYELRRRVPSPIVQISWHKLPHDMSVDLRRIVDRYL